MAENKEAGGPAGNDVERISTRDEPVALEEKVTTVADEAFKATCDKAFLPPEIMRHWAPEERHQREKKLVKKVDVRLLPIIVVMYILNYIDRNNIAAAKLAYIAEDIELTDVQFETSVSILFVGYLLMQIPSNLFLNKTGKPALYLPACMVVWGIISAATAGTTNYNGLYACRFFLGFVEAAYYPGCLYYLSCWYTRKELGLRIALLYSGALISGAFSGLIAAGVTANMDGARGLRAWRWLFILEGAITVVVACGAVFVMPDFPRTTGWLTEEERALAVWRLEEDIGQDDWIDREHQRFWQGAKQAFMDAKTYVLMVLLFCLVATGSVTNFFPSVVSTLFEDRVKALLMTSPPYVLAVLATAANAWHADRTGERYLHVALPLVVTVAAFVLAAASTAFAARYLAMLLMVPSLYSAYVVALAWISNTMPRPAHKRAAVLAFVNAVSNTSSIYASYMYPDGARPRYVVAMTVNCATAVVAVCAATVLRFMLVRLNRKLEAGVHVEGAINAVPGEAVAHGFRFKY